MCVYVAMSHCLFSIFFCVTAHLPPTQGAVLGGSLNECQTEVFGGAALLRPLGAY